MPVAEHNTTAANLNKLSPGDHTCGLYRTEEDIRSLMFHFVQQGVERGEKICYILNAHSAAELMDVLTQGGLNPQALIDKGQLVLLTSKEAYMREREFHPDRMVALLAEETDKAIAEGYSALRATGEMTWALAGEPGSERLIEYEAKLNDFFVNSRCLGVCQYDMRRFDAELLLEVLHTHPRVMLDMQPYDNTNAYYVPGQLNEARESKMLHQWLKNLKHHPLTPKA
jgi:hypothetical protein